MGNLQRRICFSLLAAGLAAGTPLLAQAERFASAGAQGYCLTNSGGSATITGCSTSVPGQNISMDYKAGENVFYGQLKAGGQCLDASGARLVFAGCKAGDAQIWKLTGNTGMLNNGAGNCVGVASGSLTTSKCSAGGSGLTWWTEKRARVIAVPNMKSVAVGTKLKISGNNLIANDGASIVAGGAGNIVAGGAGNIVAGGAGNIVAGGAGN
ncbi:MAG: ricin-type beta-trefoil lectin domain protein [Pseudomonadota bacterium]